MKSIQVGLIDIQNQPEGSVLINSFVDSRGVFRTLSNSWDEAFCGVDPFRNSVKRIICR